MAWTPPVATTIGQLMTAAFWNAQVTANILEQSQPPSAAALAPLGAGGTVSVGNWFALSAPVFNTGLTYSAGVFSTTAANAGAFTVITPGRYLITGSNQFNGVGTATGKGLQLGVNGVVVAAAADLLTTAGSGVQLSASAIANCVAGDRIQISMSFVGGTAPGATGSLQCAMLYRT